MTSGTPVPGWYADPYDAEQLRYWDGATWTGFTAPSAQAPQPAHGTPGSAAGPPMSGYGSGYGTPGSASGDDRSGLGDVGGWLRDGFNAVVDRIVPLSILLVAVPTLVSVLISLTLWLTVADLRIDGLRNDDVSVSGLRPGLLLLALLLLLAWVPVAVVTSLAAGHQLYGAVSGQARSLGQSMRVGMRRLPRALGWLVVAIVAWLVPIVVALGLPPILAIATGEWAPLALWLVTLPLVAILFLWLGVRLFHAPTAILLAPPRTGPLRVSMGLTRGRWLATLGRALLLVVLVMLVQGALQFTGSVAVQAAAVSAITTDQETGEPLIDGRPVSELDSLVVGDLLPGGPLMVVLGALSGAGQGLVNVIWLAGAVGLYARVGGPVDERL